MFEISGSVKKIFEEQTFGSGFNKREFVVTVPDGRFPQDLKFETVKDKTSLVGALKEGDEVKVSFDIRGREWKENYYVNLNAWKIESVSAASGDAPDSDSPPLREPDGPVDPIDEEPPF
jgi:single-strand DNA-binding protein